MSKQPLHLNSSNVYAALFAIVLGTFVKSCVHPTWISAVELISAITLTGFVVWVNPMRKLEVQREEFDELTEQCALLKEQLTALRLKLGFQRS